MRWLRLSRSGCQNRLVSCIEIGYELPVFRLAGESFQRRSIGAPQGINRRTRTPGTGAATPTAKSSRGRQAAGEIDEEASWPLGAPVGAPFVRFLSLFLNIVLLKTRTS